MITASKPPPAARRVWCWPPNASPPSIVLDIGLPDLSGHEVLRRLREWTNVPVIILSVLGDSKGKVAAFDAGADDYVTKPFNTDELLARMRGVMRRAAKSSPPPFFTRATWWWTWRHAG